jgi:Protein of unknown function (DUF4058)
MPSPFPGMNPYLEDPFFWREVHNRIIVELANDLGARLRPKYYAAIETRTYTVQLVEPIEVKERFLEVRRVKTHEVIVAIEILLPQNKRGDGRSSYLRKRQAIFESHTHLVEIDFLRAHSPMPMRKVNYQHDYRILVSDAAQRPNAELYGFNVRDRIPSFPVPLQPEDPPVLVDLQPLLHTVYEQGNFDLRIDYQQPVPQPDLSEGDRAWVQQILAVLDR